MMQRKKKYAEKVIQPFEFRILDIDDLGINIKDVIAVGINIKDVIAVYDIIWGKVTESEHPYEYIKRCDEVVRKLGLDRERNTYFKNSRKILLDSKKSLEKSDIMGSTYFTFEECDGTVPMIIPSEVLNIHNFIFTIETIELEEHSNEPLDIIINWEYELSHVKQMRRM